MVLHEMGDEGSEGSEGEACWVGTGREEKGRIGAC